MIIKVDRNIDNTMFGISDIRLYSEPEESAEYEHTMIVYINVNDVKMIYSLQDLNYVDPSAIVINFYDGLRMELELHEDDLEVKMKNIERFIETIQRLKMLGTKWENEHPEKYI